jgi:hypothetical protein
MGEKLQKAANAAYPNGNRSRYTAVYVLLLCWEDEDPRLPVSMEVNELEELFCDAYHFEDVEVWKIPSDGSHKRLNRKVLDFVELGGDSKHDLKIVYYGGHGMLSCNRQSSWARYAYRIYFAAIFVFNIPRLTPSFSRADPKDPSYQTVKWSGIQHALEEAESDVLLLFDCCASGTANTDVGRGVTELIAACGFNASANPVGPDSFTRALITELHLLSRTPSFTVGSLYNKVLCRVQNWMPSGKEMQRPPLHVVLTQCKTLPRSIQLSRRPLLLNSQEVSPTENICNTSSTVQEASGPSKKRRRTRNIAEPTAKRKRTRSTSPSPSSSPQDSDESNLFEESSIISSESSVVSEQVEYPRIAITIRLGETLEPHKISTDLLEKWIKMMPVLAEHVKVEAGFASCSTLLVLSLPIPLWCYLPDHPAVSVAGIIKSPIFVLDSFLLGQSASPKTLKPNAALGSIRNGDELSIISTDSLAKVLTNAPWTSVEEEALIAMKERGMRWADIAMVSYYQLRRYAALGRPDSKRIRS